MHESSRYIVVTTSLLVGEATKPSNIENTLCIMSEARRRDEKHIVANRLLAPSREGAPGCSVLCVRYWTDTIFAFSFPLCPPLSLCLIAFLFLFLSHPSPPPSSLLSVDEGEPRSVEDPIHIPSTLTKSVQCTTRTIVPYFIGNFDSLLSSTISISSESDSFRIGLLAIFSSYGCIVTSSVTLF